MIVADLSQHHGQFMRQRQIARGRGHVVMMSSLAGVMAPCSSTARTDPFDAAEAAPAGTARSNKIRNIKRPVRSALYQDSESDRIAFICPSSPKSFGFSIRFS